MGGNWVIGNIPLKGTWYQVLLFLCYWLLRTCKKSSFLCLMLLSWWAMVPQTTNTGVNSSPWLSTKVIHFSSYADCLYPFCYNRELPNALQELCVQPPFKEASCGPFVNELPQRSLPSGRSVSPRPPYHMLSSFLFFFFLDTHMRHPQSLKVPMSLSWRKDIFVCWFVCSFTVPNQWAFMEPWT